MHHILKIAHQLKNEDNLIKRFPISNGIKTRWVNDPIPVLKDHLKEWNIELTTRYVALLKEFGLDNHSHAYLPGKSIKTNAMIHQHSRKIIKFDFSGFYDSVVFNYIADMVVESTQATPDELALIERLIIDPSTGGVTQGLPVSGALAGIALIPFWEQLVMDLDPNIQFTQYSDDLTFSLKSNKETKTFNIEDLTSTIYESLARVDREFKLNKGKTTEQVGQYRKITGVRINHNNQTTCSRKDYRQFRTISHVLSKDSNTNDVLAQFGYKSKASFTGKISYMRTIDDTGKIDKLIDQYAETFLKHNLFKTWIIDKLSVYS